MAITKQSQQRQTCRVWPQKSKQTDVKHRTMNISWSKAGLWGERRLKRSIMLTLMPSQDNDCSKLVKAFGEIICTDLWKHHQVWGVRKQPFWYWRRTKTWIEFWYPWIYRVSFLNIVSIEYRGMKSAETQRFYLKKKKKATDYILATDTFMICLSIAPSSSATSTAPPSSSLGNCAVINKTDFVVRWFC